LSRHKCCGINNQEYGMLKGYLRTEIGLIFMHN